MDMIKPPKDQFERQIWLVAMLRLKKSSYADIARELGVTRVAVCKAAWKKNTRMEKAIAAKIGYTPELIWPERYQTNSAEQYRNLPCDSMTKPKGNNRY